MASAPVAFACFSKLLSELAELRPAGCRSMRRGGEGKTPAAGFGRRGPRPPASGRAFSYIGSAARWAQHKAWEHRRSANRLGYGMPPVFLVRSLSECYACLPAWPSKSWGWCNRPATRASLSAATDVIECVSRRQGTTFSNLPRASWYPDADEFSRASIRLDGVGSPCPRASRMLGLFARVAWPSVSCSCGLATRDSLSTARTRSFGIPAVHVA